MKLQTIVEELHLTVKTGASLLDRDVSGGYAGDLLSDVLANARAGNLWVTLHTHPNIVAVASSKDLAAIILVNGRTPEPDTLRKAEEENIPILISNAPTYSVVCKLGELGIT